jgi:hypothetical protein
MLDLHDMFQLPMTIEAFQQYNSLMEDIDSLEITQEDDNWIYIWGTSKFSVHRAYTALSGHMTTHPIFIKLWASKCQPKHIVFFWLLMQDKLSTRGRLHERHMALDSYACENYILQRLETSYCWVDLNPDRSNRVRVFLHRSAAALIGGVSLLPG